MDNKLRKEFIDNFWLGLGDVTKIATVNPFLAKKYDDPILSMIDFMRRPENISFTFRHLFNKTLHTSQAAILQELWYKPFPMLIATRGFGKSTLLGWYAVYRALFTPGSKVVLIGGAFRQAKHIFEHCEALYKSSPMFRDILSDNRDNKPTRQADRCIFRIGDSKIIALPLGTGDKIRGERATHLITDEYRSINQQIYEEVVQGFSSVAANPMENVQYIGRLHALEQLGEISKEEFKEGAANISSNQSIIAGTCGYDFEDFAKKWKTYKAIIESRGDERKVNAIFNGEIPPGFNWRDYCVMRIPYELTPQGFMDEKAIGKSKATVTVGVFAAEYGACFIKDSDGFYKRSLIETAVCGRKTPIVAPSCGEVNFHAVIRGISDRKYIYGIDPASESDKFAIVIIELWGDHRRIVYCWTMNKKQHEARLKKGLAEEHDYNRYCARKIRDLMKIFPCERIVMDKMGGGTSIREALADPINLKDNEVPIYEIIEEDKEKYTDNLVGQHILELAIFANNEWLIEANFGMKKDFEDKTLIFPYFDNISIAVASEQDRVSGIIDVNEDKEELLYDTLENCVFEIEELKDELATIQHSKTASGRDRWDTPEIKLPNSKKGRLRKDRYSALLLANSFARSMNMVAPEFKIETGGGFAGQLSAKKDRKIEGNYIGPAWFTEKMNQISFKQCKIN